MPVVGGDDRDDFDLRIAKMEDIVPPCTKQLLELTQCVNEARSNPTRYFTDYLTLLKLNGGWRVVSKTFRTDVRE